MPQLDDTCTSGQYAITIPRRNRDGRKLHPANRSSVSPSNTRHSTLGSPSPLAYHEDFRQVDKKWDGPLPAKPVDWTYFPSGVVLQNVTTKKTIPSSKLSDGGRRATYSLVGAVTLASSKLNIAEPRFFEFTVSGQWRERSKRLPSPRMPRALAPHLQHYQDFDKEESENGANGSSAATLCLEQRAVSDKTSAKKNMEVLWWETSLVTHPMHAAAAAVVVVVVAIYPWCVLQHSDMTIPAVYSGSTAYPIVSRAKPMQDLG
ncbi:hypothetical protein GGR50DRAFT_692732 [Xylaria sp. CBS 124048]|nr:hypothetical protein GGR50DRAFT_692732 [Xylaria sp. CBS 124048]